ncbi:hypothetical protein HYH02_008131 [Chlamydomonas schloesseri]|uniref:chloroplast protein-transporting ATPase n=1 Tax=Chlamydomonas schloesseri TaxID=2026947 RepID=A0A836B413_9CHLO|nr:hypothetical protein HYH02_008131 [Chlamydomonas schloesseri]|eukprot:KAG2446977.1 hypothetical protein HYH02_008131 [Chlamydomonas schloesseri]
MRPVALSSAATFRGGLAPGCPRPGAARHACVEAIALVADRQDAAEATHRPRPAVALATAPAPAAGGAAVAHQQQHHHPQPLWPAARTSGAGAQAAVAAAAGALRRDADCDAPGRQPPTPGAAAAAVAMPRCSCADAGPGPSSSSSSSSGSGSSRGGSSRGSSRDGRGVRGRASFAGGWPAPMHGSSSGSSSGGTRGVGGMSAAPTRGAAGRAASAVAARSTAAATGATATASAAAGGGSSSGGGGGGGAGAETYQLPAHWQDQMARAPLGRKRVLQRYYADVIAINNLEPAMRVLNNAQLRNKTNEFRQRLAEGAPLASLRAEAFAVVREASRRVLGMRHYDCQLVGGMVLAEGQVAEMATGEGKTLVATLPGYLGALTGRGVHVVTVNDYLAARDAAWMGKLYRFLGLTCAAVQSNCPVAVARAAFACDVTYVTGQELCFSYLKDNTALSPADLTLRDSGFHFAIVDEVDSILIDESRNPMIISSRGACDTSVVVTVDVAVRKLWVAVAAELESALAAEPPASLSDTRRREVEKAVKSRYYIVDEKTRTVSYTEAGTYLIFLNLVEQGARFSDPYPDVHCLWEEEVPWGRLATTAMSAYELYINGRDYIVREGEVVIVDQSTGRLKANTRWQGGIHQAVEAKEGLPIQAENLVTATVTFQLFFRQYAWLAGMTGTAQPAAAELFELYGIKVVPVPTNRPSRRIDHQARLYYDKALKMHALAEEVQAAVAQHRPVLIGTTSVQESELVLNYLNHTILLQSSGAAGSRNGRSSSSSGNGNGSSSGSSSAAPTGGLLQPRVTLLNAKPELVRVEAQVIAQAGLPGAVTIATNMAGRGTDIILGGNPEGLTKLALMRLVYRRLLKADERETLPAVPLPPLDPYDTDDFTAITSIPFSTPDAPHAGLPRPLHEALATAILTSIALSPAGMAAATTANGSTASVSLSSTDLMNVILGNGGGGAANGNGNGNDNGAAAAAAGAAAALAAATAGMSYSQTSELLAWVMDRAEVLRRKVRGQLRRTYRSHTAGLESLNFTVCVAPVAAAVLAAREQERLNKQVRAVQAAQQQPQPQAPQDSAAATAAAVASAAAAAMGRPDSPVVGSGSSFTDDDEATAAMAAVAATGIISGGGGGGGGLAGGGGGGGALADEDEEAGEEPIAQVQALRAALYLWLWFDQECARHREEVRAAGGLLVLGTSLNESPRIELQLRGRAGRQGDPGESKMLLDCTDPLMVVFGMDKVSALLNQMGSQLQTGPDYLDGGVVEYLVNYVVRWHESMSKNMRLETQKYDAVMEEYRRNLYTLRRLVLTGGDMQRGQIAYVLIQRYVDELVGRHLDAHSPPQRWLEESVRAELLPACQLLPGVAPPQSTVTQQALGVVPPVLVSPLQAVLHCLRVLVNPPGRTTKTFVDFSAVTTAAATDPTVRKTLELFGVAKGGEGSGQPSSLPVYMQVEELEVLSPEQIANLAAYIAGTGPLQWPVPPQREIAGNFKLQLQLLTHRRLFGYGGSDGADAAAVVGGGGGGPAAAAARAARMQFSRLPGLMQRPPLEGPFAEKVGVLRNYLGELLIGCYEARRLAARLTFTSSPSLGFTDIDADQQVCGVEQQTMLLWMDALWSCFLEDTTRLRNAVNIRSTNGSNPVSEFRIEANAAFLALLDNYRDAVLDKLLVPDFAIYAPLAGEEGLFGEGVAGVLSDSALVGSGGVSSGGGNGGSSGSSSGSGSGSGSGAAPWVKNGVNGVNGVSGGANGSHGGNGNGAGQPGDWQPPQPTPTPAPQEGQRVRSPGGGV